MSLTVPLESPEYAKETYRRSHDYADRQGHDARLRPPRWRRWAGGSSGGVAYAAAGGCHRRPVRYCGGLSDLEEAGLGRLGGGRGVELHRDLGRHVGLHHPPHSALARVLYGATARLIHVLRGLGNAPCYPRFSDAGTAPVTASNTRGSRKRERQVIARSAWHQVDLLAHPRALRGARV